jgi:hypothetical protein
MVAASSELKVPAFTHAAWTPKVGESLLSARVMQMSNLSKEKKVAFGCWSNEMPIAEKGQCGMLHRRIFSTEKLAREYYRPEERQNCDRDDVIVRVTVETIDD